jgi:adenylosuccinate lyase
MMMIAKRCMSSTSTLVQLKALSSVDGRYAGKVDNHLRETLSEYGLIRQRHLVELRWLARLSRVPEVLADMRKSSSEHSESSILSATEAAERSFDDSVALRVKQLESVTNHDVKSVEYAIKERLDDAALSEFVHFAATSEDVNNVCYARMVKEARDRCVLPAQRSIVVALAVAAGRDADAAMLARTHGQPATPTTMGKELANFGVRLARHERSLRRVAVLGKWNGAVGNYNAHCVAYPSVDWPSVAADFVRDDLGLEFNAYTTQIEPHDWMAELFDAVARFNTALLDLCRDLWQYIASGYFELRVVDGEVGSSTMPHKVNPIDFENAEGNLGVANALLAHMAAKLPVSRLQRDLSDSTVLRNIGTALAHSTVAYESALRGLSKLGAANQAAMRADLDRQHAVLAEPIQTVMRRHAVPEAYERLKALTRGRQTTIDAAAIRQFIDSQLVDVLPADAIERLRALEPHTYTGHAQRLATQFSQQYASLDPNDRWHD